MDRRYTYADYRTWPDDERWELIDGVAWNMSPAPNRRHQGLLGELYVQVVNGVKATACRLYLAPFDVFLPDSADQEEDDVTSVVQPDLTGICDASRLTPRGCFGAPDWVVEIISPWTMKKDLNEKFAALRAQPDPRVLADRSRAAGPCRSTGSGPTGRYGEAADPRGERRDRLPARRGDRGEPGRGVRRGRLKASGSAAAPQPFVAAGLSDSASDSRNPRPSRPAPMANESVEARSGTRSFSTATSCGPATPATPHAVSTAP